MSCGPTNRDGTTWGQTFAYDPFGNISKSVPPSMTGISWLPGYNTNNHYTLGGTSYDGNGNLTADTFNTYAWDSDANTIGINLGGSAPINVTYDAFDRIVEENNSGTYKQILYSPIGKLAVMARQNTNNIFLPLPGGEQATYTGNTIRFRHYDWLGSARFESNMAEQEYGDVAYAPFGETYSIKNTPYLSFTGQQQDTISGTYDFLYRKYNPVQGRWISPDPAGVAAVNPANPQSWNRYAYVGDSPLSAVDPLGQWFEWVQGFDTNGRECRLDGFVTPCAMVQSALQADIAVNCPQCLPGQRVGADNLIYGYNPSTSGEVYWTSPDDMYHFALTMGGWGVVGSVAANNGWQPGPDPIAIQDSMRETMLAPVKAGVQRFCGSSPAARDFKSLWHGAALGATTGAYTGFVSGEVFFGTVSLGTSGVGGAALGGFIGGVFGGAKGVFTGFVLAEGCQAIGAYGG